MRTVAGIFTFIGCALMCIGGLAISETSAGIIFSIAGLPFLLMGLFLSKKTKDVVVLNSPKDHLKLKILKPVQPEQIQHDEISSPTSDLNLAVLNPSQDQPIRVRSPKDNLNSEVLSHPPDKQPVELLKEGIAALRAGNKQEARNLLERLVQTYPQSEGGWLWFSEVVNKTEERRFCMTQVLSINPYNTHAQRGLKILGPGAIQSPLSEQKKSPFSLRRLSSHKVVQKLVNTAEEDKVIETADIQATDASNRFSSPRIISIIGTIIIICAGLLPWAQTQWLLDTEYHIGLASGYGLFSTGIAVVALILLGIIKKNTTATLWALLCAGAASMSAWSVFSVNGLNLMSKCQAGMCLRFGTNLSIGVFAVFLGTVLIAGGFLMSLARPKKDIEQELFERGEVALCPYCKEVIKFDATICQHCGQTLSAITGY